MIGWFPSPYPDELLYSICARYGEVVQYPTKQSLNAELLGSVHAASVIDMPLHLDHLASVLPPNHTYSVDSLVRSHTLFPFYAPFIPSERVARIKEMMRSGTSNKVHSVLGISKCAIRRPEWLRFCPVCVERDRKLYGETYWRRSHQIPGVEVCPDHMTFLERGHFSVRNPKYDALYVAAEQTIGVRSVNVSSLDGKGKSHQILVRLARDAAWLLNQNLYHDYESLRAGYRTSLMDRGLASHSGIVKTKELMQAIKEAYPRTLLVALQCDFDEKTRHNWVGQMPYRLNNEINQHPLRHLLLIQLLGYTAESFFAHCLKQLTVRHVIQAEPFGTGPYLSFAKTSSAFSFNNLGTRI